MSRVSRWVGVLMVCLAVALGGCDKIKEMGSASKAPAVPDMTSGTIDLGAKSAPPLVPGYPDTQALARAFMAKQIKTASGPKTGDEIFKQRDIEYAKAGDTSLKLDFYRPANASKPLPCIVAIHGGGWESGKKADMLNLMVMPFVVRGYVAASVDYRLAAQAKYPAAIQDVKAAIRYLRANAQQYFIDPDKIIVVGVSAGAHLAMMAAYATDVPAFENVGGNEGVSSKVQGCIQFYGPTDLTAEWARTNGIVERFLGKKYEEAPELYAEASPITYVKADSVPTLMFHGTIDDTVVVAQADALAEKLKSVNAPYFYDKVPGWPHLMEAQLDLNKRFNYFIDQYLAKYAPLTK